MALFSACILLIGCLTVSSSLIKRSMYCRNCSGEECDKFPTPSGTCEFGGYRDLCESANCYRGPGEKCSYPKSLCAGNMDCICGKCVGCLIERVDKPCYSHEAFCEKSTYMRE